MLLAFSGIDLGVTGVILLIVFGFALFGFIKGLIKSLFAILTIAAGGLAAWWGYNYGHSLLSQHFTSLPSHTNIIVASFAGVLTFYAFYRLFAFLVNPFEKSNLLGKLGVGVPAALISLILAFCLVCVCSNRMRTTDALAEIKHTMDHGLESSHQRNGFHARAVRKLNESAFGQLLLEYDPVWEQNRLTLALLVVDSSQLNTSQFIESKREIVSDSAFQNHLLRDPEVQNALQDKDAAKLWNSEALKIALRNGKWTRLLNQGEL